MTWWVGSSWNLQIHRDGIPAPAQPQRTAPLHGCRGDQLRSDELFTFAGRIRRTLRKIESTEYLMTHHIALFSFRLS